MTEKMLCLITRDDGGEPVITVSPTDVSLGNLQKLVGGYLESVRIQGMPDAHAYVDEEGLLKQLPVNPVASLLCGRPICGPMVILGNGPDGTEGDCPEEIYGLLKAVGVG